VSSLTFPLPTLGPSLKHLAHELHSGRGFFVLRGIPVSSYSRFDNVLIYAGVTSYVAPTRALQDKNGGVLSHIKDLTKTHSPESIGGPAYTTDKQVFHTDQGSDLVSLFALETAAEGGISRISSSWRVYNELAEHRPDLIQTLAEPWVVDELILFQFVYFFVSHAVLDVDSSVILLPLYGLFCTTWIQRSSSSTLADTLLGF
jgi:hypothetical protein